MSRVCHVSEGEDPQLQPFQNEIWFPNLEFIWWFRYIFQSYGQQYIVIQTLVRRRWGHILVAANTSRFQPYGPMDDWCYYYYYQYYYYYYYY